MKSTYKVDGMHCASCVMNIEEALLDVDGVTDAEASLRSSKVTVEHDDDVTPETLASAAKEAGYQLSAS
ncbi:MAG: heavy-metal-associated domain-containing protein [Polaromonas sp.]|nr:heavy-metal-associated domain-containing protein [Gemmatimonadaceae bacterium]